MMDTSTPLGERIAFHRRRRGLSQVKLAGLVARSESWLSQIERGVRSIDRISVLNQVAVALNVPVTELAPGSFAPRSADEPEATVALRSALTRYDWVGALLGDSAEVSHPVDTLRLRSDVDAAWELMHASSFTQLGHLMPALILRAEAAVGRARGDGHKTALGLLAEAYQIAAATLSKLDETDLAWLAGDRAVSASVRAEDPLLATASVLRIAHAFLAGGRHEEALHLAATTAKALTAVLDDAAGRISLYGGLSLAAAVAATRMGDGYAALNHLEEAEGAADRLGDDRNDFHTEFGPTNVALHAVAVAVELGDAGQALRRASAIDASGLSAVRRARFLIDIARANGQRRKVTEAVRALEEAEGLTPEQVRANTRVRELVRDLLRIGGPNVDPRLGALARRLGVLP